MLRIVLTTSLLLTWGALTASADERPTWGERADRLRDVLAVVDSLMAEGRYEQVVAMGAGDIRDDALGPEVLWPLAQRMGLAYQRLGRFDEALPHLENAVLWAQLDPVNHRNLAQLLLAMGRRGRAFSEYRDACSLAPRDPALRVEFAHVLLDYDQPERAVRHIREAEELAGRTPQVARVASRLHLARGDYAAAVPYLAVLHAAGPDLETTEQFALALQRTGDSERSRDLLLPFWPGGLSDLGRRVVLEADRRLGDPTRAMALGGLEDATWSDPDFWALAALVCYDAGEDRPGLLLVDRAIALAPQSAVHRNNRVALLLRLGMDEEADREWAVVLELDPSLSGNRTEHTVESPRR